LISFVGVGPGEVEAQPVGLYFSLELTATGEVSQIEELVFFEAMHGFDIALVSVRGGACARAGCAGKSPLSSAALSVCQIRSRSETP